MSNPFEDHINNHTNLDDIDGASCKIIHPLVEEALEKMGETEDDPHEMMSPVLRQMIACSSNEVLDFLINDLELEMVDMPDGTYVIPLDIETLTTVIQHSMNITMIVRNHLSENSDLEI